MLILHFLCLLTPFFISFVALFFASFFVSGLSVLCGGDPLVNVELEAIFRHFCELEYDADIVARRAEHAEHAENAEETRVLRVGFFFP